jgi:hypothetical protein
MLKHMLALTGALTMCAGAALAGPSCPACGAQPTNANTEKVVEKTETTKLTEVKVCPMTGEAVRGNGAGHQVVGEYEVYFCCGGCKKAFNKLSKEEQAKRVADAAAKQAENRKEAQKDQ